MGTSPGGQGRFIYFSNTFSIWPIFFWTLPAIWSFCPSAASVGLLVTFSRLLFNFAFHFLKAALDLIARARFHLFSPLVFRKTFLFCRSGKPSRPRAATLRT
jgi:hypothetical protein